MTNRCVIEFIVYICEYWVSYVYILAAFGFIPFIFLMYNNKHEPLWHKEDKKNYGLPYYW